MHDEDETTRDLLDRARQGDVRARAELLALHTARLERLIASRLDPRIQGRIDPVDVLQETLLAVHNELAAYLENPPIPFYPWLRGLALHFVARAHRAHIDTQSRSVRREAAASGPLESDSALQRLARSFAKDATPPADRLVRREKIDEMRRALARLPEVQRETLELRYIEDLPWSTVSAVQGGSEEAARVRHLRAVRRLRELMETGSSSG